MNFYFEWITYVILKEKKMICDIEMDDIIGWKENTPEIMKKRCYEYVNRNRKEDKNEIKLSYNGEPIMV